MVIFVLVLVIVIETQEIPIVQGTAERFNNQAVGCRALFARLPMVSGPQNLEPIDRFDKIGSIIPRHTLRTFGISRIETPIHQSSLDRPLGSVRQNQNISQICDEHLRGRHDLEMIDLYQQLVLAKDEQILAAPMSIGTLPLPLHRLIGDIIPD